MITRDYIGTMSLFTEMSKIKKLLIINKDMQLKSRGKKGRE